MIHQFFVQVNIYEKKYENATSCSRSDQQCWSKGKTWTIVNVRSVTTKCICLFIQYGFTRFPMLGNVHEFINVSKSNDVENRQDLCNFTIFLHNANDLKDVENISLTASLEILEDNFTISNQVTFSVIPTVLVMLPLLDFYTTLFQMIVFVQYLTGNNSIISFPSKKVSGLNVCLQLKIIKILMKIQILNCFN